MPGSSILALDDIAEYYTIEGNVFWVEGKILDGVGMRKNERGVVAVDNFRVMFKKEYEARRKDGLGTRWVNVEGRKPLDDLMNKITTDISKSQWKGWPGNPPVGIPSGSNVQKKGKDLELPEGSNVTIEE
jgi:hypothetical protein